MSIFHEEHATEDFDEEAFQTSGSIRADFLMPPSSMQMLQRMADMLLEAKKAKAEAERKSECYRKENADLARRLEQSELENEHIRAECRAIQRASAVYLSERLNPVAHPVVSPSAPSAPVGTKKEKEPLSALETKISRAITVMQQEDLFKRAYDYVWVMLVMNQTDGLPHFDSPSSFHSYLLHIGVANIPSVPTLKKKAAVARCAHPSWKFSDTADVNETRRRNNVASRFLSLFRKG